MKKGLLILLLGVSWAWKNTMLRLLIERHPQYKQLLSCKTRPLREWEKDGVDYTYMTDEQFHTAIKDNIFLEYAKVHDMYYYGTKKTDILLGLEQGDIMIKEIDIQWVMDIEKQHPEIYEHTLRLFLDLSEETMIQRITHRAVIWDEELQKRLKSVQSERELAATYCPYCISAEGSIEEVYERVDTIITNYIAKGE